MSDDTTTSAITHGLALVTGGGASGLIVRLLFGGFLKRLDDIEANLKSINEKMDTRHEKIIERVGQLEAKADAAHRRLDDVNARLDGESSGGRGRRRGDR